MIRYTVVLICLAVLGCSGTGTVETETELDLELPTVTTDATDTSSPAQVATEEDPGTKPIVIDVRSAAEWDTGHLASAVNIPHTEIADRIGEVTNDKDAQIVVHCRSGGRSEAAKKALEELGFTNVENVGGYDDAKARFAE